MRARSRGKLALGVLVAAVAFDPAPALAATTETCSGEFQGHVRRGPSADLSLVGRLTIELPSSGRITGRLVQREGTRRIRVATVRGASEGRTLTLRFRTLSGKRISGIGTARRRIVGCRDRPRRGRLLGPRRDDRGDWGWALGG